MAGFEGIKWAPTQMRYSLLDKSFELHEIDSTVPAVTRSIHYGLFLVFEGIRFFCKRNQHDALEVIFLNWEMNLERFQRGIAFNLSGKQQHLVPTVDELKDIFIEKFFKESSMQSFLEGMADLGAQGYLRPFTVDEERSIGVTFPQRPCIRAVVCRYDQYLGEPFNGVVVPQIVRAVGVNGTGCLKLGVNYLMSIKAVDKARQIMPDAASALLLDDRPDLPVTERCISEWDSSCCLFALKNGTVIKIPESPLILPSVTIQGITSILSEFGIPVLEQDMKYGELIKLVNTKQLVAVCSVGTAGILNRCNALKLLDENDDEIVTHYPDVSHELYEKLNQAKRYYWQIYSEQVKVPAGMRVEKIELSD